MKMSESIQGRERYNIMLRYDRPFREDPDDLFHILIPTPQGQHIPLGELASIKFVEGPPMIKSENIISNVNIINIAAGTAISMRALASSICSNCPDQIIE
jgi:Cu/Ag efflux pump CusA